MSHTVRTSILMLSDTHGMAFGKGWVKPTRKVDVAIHCGDLTKESKLDEFATGINMLREIDASLRLVIAGNHEITLDDPTFKMHLAASDLAENDKEVVGAYGSLGQARAMLTQAAEDIMFLDEGTYKIPLQNGSLLTVFASPFTPRKEALGANEPPWAFQYDRASGQIGGHQYDIQRGTDIVITHGPPLGIMDRAQGRRAGCSDLFAAVCRARPLLHCFGHIHAGWGAKLVAWRRDTNDTPSHFTDIENDQSVTLETLANLRAADGTGRVETYQLQGCCPLSTTGPMQSKQTLFVNAAVEGCDEIPVQPPIVTEVDLPRAPRETDSVE